MGPLDTRNAELRVRAARELLSQDDQARKKKAPGGRQDLVDGVIGTFWPQIPTCSAIFPKSCDQNVSNPGRGL